MVESASLVQHLDPNQDRFGMAGIALLIGDHDPHDVKKFYDQHGSMPAAHPAVLYEVRKRDPEADKLNRTFITLDGDRVLELGTHFFHVHYGRQRLEPKPADFELARKTLDQIGILEYTTTVTGIDGRKVTLPVDITGQIEYLLGSHLATPVRKS